MGNVFAEITIKNAGDIALAEEGHIAENGIRSVTLTAIVDTGATTLVINEEIFKQLGLTVKETPTSMSRGAEGYNVKLPLR